MSHKPVSGRHLYLHVARGGLEVNGTPLSGGDGAMIEEEEARVILKGKPRAEALLFALP